MKKILITGGCGFIGSHLCDRLISDGHEVVILDNLSTGKRENIQHDVHIVEGDILDFPLLQELMNDCDACFHLAAIASVTFSTEHWLASHQTNLVGCLNVFECARQHPKGPIPVLYASSAAVYGDSQNLPLQESDVTKPLSAYGVDKYTCELQARVAGLVYAVPTLGYRFFNVFGPRQDPNSPYSGVIAIFSERLKKNLPLTVYGDGLQTRDFIYVSDIVDGLVSGLKAASTKAPVVNLSTQREVTLLQLIDDLSDILQCQPQVIHEAARQGDIRHSCGDMREAQALLGFEPKVSFKEGLREL
jgi:UDP-glucose 4-epimerase